MFRIRKLDIYIAKQFGLLFLGTFFICQFVLMMQFLWRYVDELIGKGLSMDILAQFFWYMGLMLIPQALPLAILLSSLITFGNLGENSELTAIKAAGVSLMQAFRSLIVISVTIALTSFYFQNVIGPKANLSFAALLTSMKQTNPELQIPEGVFYDGIPNCNIYVQKKDMERGKLYGVMIYRLTNSYDDAAIILADSGTLRMTAEKKHLLLHLFSGEWFENIHSGELGNTANIPYRRETFSEKTILIPFDAGFNEMDAGAFSGNVKTKSLKKIVGDLDSIKAVYDSVGHSYYEQEQAMLYYLPKPHFRDDSLRIAQMAKDNKVPFDTIFERLRPERKQQAVQMALMKAQTGVSNLEFKGYVMKEGDKYIRKHYIEAIAKFTLSFACIVFFFIGAPLGAIIRKGGMGVPVIISVLVFIVYYIFENSGTKMARDGQWPLWFGCFISTMVLTPLAIFFTYKGNNDSAVFNMDAYVSVVRRMLGLKSKRYIYRKEVIINTPDYAADKRELEDISADITRYNNEHKLYTAPNPLKIFLKDNNDNEIENISERLENTIEDLSNTKDKAVLTELNHYPFLAVHAHTSPFRRRRWNVLTLVVLPVGIFFYFRIWRFRLLLLRDLRNILKTNEAIIARCAELEEHR